MNFSRIIMPPILPPHHFPYLSESRIKAQGRNEHSFPVFLSDFINQNALLCEIPKITLAKKLKIEFNNRNSKISSSSRSPLIIIQKSLPFAASLALLLSVSATPASAGLLSGFSGLESVPGPQLPQIDFLNRLNEENQKKYAENDARFKSSPILKELLERSKMNKEKNRQGIIDKYCIRGAEWGVGDCSAEGMSPQEKDDFISMLKQKAGLTD